VFPPASFLNGFFVHQLLESMFAHDIESGWTVEWATPTPGGGGYRDNLVLSRDQACEYGDELVMSLRVDGGMLQERDIDPDEPFAWKVEGGELLTKQISRQSFEAVAESDRHDSGSASQVLDYRARRQISDSR
jgi:hypothetical protein